MVLQNQTQASFCSHNLPHISSRTRWFFFNWPCFYAVIASITKRFVILTSQYSSPFLSLVFSLFVLATFWQIQRLQLTFFSNFGWTQFWCYPWLLSVSWAMASKRLDWLPRIVVDVAEKQSTNASSYHIPLSLLITLHPNSNSRVVASAILLYAPSSSTWLTLGRC